MYGDVRIQVSKDVSQFFLRHDAELEHRIMVCLEVEVAATLICENNHSIVYLKEMFWPFVQVGDPQWDLALPCKAHRWPEMESEGMFTIPVAEDAKQPKETAPGCTTSCLLISLVENVLFWWTSRVSDHSVLFLRLVGVGPAVLLLALRDIPGDLLSLRNVLHYKRKKSITISP